MSLSKHFNHVFVVSTKEDVVRLCRNKLSSKATVHVYPTLSCLNFNREDMLIIDTDTVSIKELNDKKILNHPDSTTLFLVSSSSSLKDPYFVLSRFSNFSEYPHTEALNELSAPVSTCTDRVLIQKNGLIPPSINGYFGGNSNLITSVRSKLIEASKNDKPVLLLGETGTGKSTAAKLIHELSARRDRPYKFFNTSTVSDDLAETMLFGSRKGSFTGAGNSNGLFIQADTGVLFLDEFEMASLILQSKLLTVMDDGIINFAGIAVQKKVDVKLICGMNTEVSAVLNNKNFRNDLYHRFGRNVVKLPSLRERPEDIPFIVRKHLSDKKIEKFYSKNSLEKLMEYHWPGNMRELISCIDESVENCSAEKITEEYVTFESYYEYKTMF